MPRVRVIVQMKYKHLNQKERETIGQMKFAGYSLTKIAKQLQRAPSTISRELTRNRYPTNGRYIAYHAGPMYRGQRSRARRGSRYGQLQWIRGRHCCENTKAPSKPQDGLKGTESFGSAMRQSIAIFGWNESMEERPKEADDRSEIGHWEVDTIHGKNGASISTIVDRKSGYAMIGQLDARTVAATNKRLHHMISKHRDQFMTITSDNECESK